MPKKKLPDSHLVRKIEKIQTLKNSLYKEEHDLREAGHVDLATRLRERGFFPSCGRDKNASLQLLRIDLTSPSDYQWEGRRLKYVGKLGNLGHRTPYEYEMKDEMFAHISNLRREGITRKAKIEASLKENFKLDAKGPTRVILWYYEKMEYTLEDRYRDEIGKEIKWDGK